MFTHISVPVSAFVRTPVNTRGEIRVKDYQQSKIKFISLTPPPPPGLVSETKCNTPPGETLDKNNSNVISANIIPLKFLLSV